LPQVPTFVVAFGNGATINLQHYPDTPFYTATAGQRVEFLVFNWGDEYHSFHLHAHSWADNRTGILDPDDPYQRVVDDVGLLPAQSFGFQVTAGYVSGPGDWMLHCHVQAHSDARMWTIFRVLPNGGASRLSPGRHQRWSGCAFELPGRRSGRRGGDAVKAVPTGCCGHARPCYK
jgi:FtsP/CotA-like multicopper oxidase with cupredoxin domain